VESEVHGGKTKNRPHINRLVSLRGNSQTGPKGVLGRDFLFTWDLPMARINGKEIPNRVSVHAQNRKPLSNYTI
jgi:hypothetical protein